MTQPPTFIIHSAREDGFWSNEDGWVEFPNVASSFTREEKFLFHLPRLGTDDARWLPAPTEFHACNWRRWLATQEDWHPAIPPAGSSGWDNPLDTPAVRASLLRLYPYKSRPGGWRVCLWGGDDFGVERDFESFSEAWEIYSNLYHGITQADLESRGFIPA